MSQKTALTTQVKAALTDLPLSITLILLLITGIVGCSGSDRQAVGGSVTFDDEPLEIGVITLKPLQGTKSPTAMGEIRRGEFSIPADSGPHVGKFHVEIMAMRVKSGEPYDPDKAYEYNQIEQYLPSKYNFRSQLESEVKQGSNQLDFQLESK